MSQPDKSPSIWAIERRDLFDPDRLGALYVEAVRAGLWRNSNRSMLEFVALAEKAKADDTEGTPERLFASLLRRDDAGRYVTNAAEERALAQFNGPRREDLVVLAHTPVGQRSRQVDVFDASGLEHLGFTHAVLMQCFLPQARRLGREWVQKHGRTSLVVRAGYKPDPELLGGILPAGLPWGSRARLVLHYVTSEAIKSQSPEVDMGRSLRNFLTRIGAPIGGKNAKIVAEAVYDVAGAEIIIGGFDGRRATVRGSKVAKEVSFWIERGHTIQEAFWRPSMTLSHDFFEAICERPVPLNAEHLAALARSPRRMDLYLWLTYRTAAIRRGASVGIRLDDLRSIFAPDVAHSNVRHFRAAIKRDLAAVCDVHPFRVDLRGNLLELRRSPPPIPERSSVILGTAARRK